MDTTQDFSFTAILLAGTDTSRASSSAVPQPAAGSVVTRNTRMTLMICGSAQALGDDASWSGLRLRPRPVIGGGWQPVVTH